MKEKIKELDDLVVLLVDAGIELDKAPRIISKVISSAQQKKISVMKALIMFANSGADPDSDEYHLYIALQNVNSIKMKQLESLNEI